MSQSEQQMPQQLRDERVRRDLAAYWAVHKQVQEQARDAAMEELREDPVLAPVIDSAGADAEAEAEMAGLTARAFEDEEWAPYLAKLHELGVAYGQMGLEFEHWIRATTAYRRHVVPHLLERYAGDPEQLTWAVCGQGTYFDLVLQTVGEAYLRTREETISKQRAAIAELSTPVLQIRPGLLLLPVVGVIDTSRSRQLTESLLQAIRDTRARVVVMDITGVPEVDSEVANRLVQAAEAARLMGASPVLTGISAGVAQTLVSLGVDLMGLRTVGDLQSGVEVAHEVLGVRVVSGRPARAEER